jgi:hypothetical protein
MVQVKHCKFPKDCKLELDYGTGVSECFHHNCNKIGFLGRDGNLYNDPRTLKEIKNDT